MVPLAIVPALAARSQATEARQIAKASKPDRGFAHPRSPHLPHLDLPDTAHEELLPEQFLDTQRTVAGATQSRFCIASLAFGSMSKICCEPNRELRRANGAPELRRVKDWTLPIHFEQLWGTTSVRPACLHFPNRRC